MGLKTSPSLISFAKSGSNPLVGQINIAAGTNCTLSQSGSAITINNTATASSTMMLNWNEATTTWNNTTTYSSFTSWNGDTISVTSGSTYAIRMSLIVSNSSSATPKFKFQFKTTNCTGTMYLGITGMMAATTQMLYVTGSLASGSPIESGAINIPITQAVVIYAQGTFVCTGTGTITIEGAQSAANASNTILQKGAILEVLKV